jgi:hypothetical protein
VVFLRRPACSGGKEDCLAGYGSSVITKREDASRGLTREELLALPAALDLETANRALSLSCTTGYDGGHRRLAQAASH